MYAEVSEQNISQDDIEDIDLDEDGKEGNAKKIFSDISLKRDAVIKNITQKRNKSDNSVEIELEPYSYSEMDDKAVNAEILEIDDDIFDTEPENDRESVSSSIPKQGYRPLRYG